ncbi:MAG: alternative ribosome rescue aminoacyl-tRNA hydrolase ArfB [Dermatophilaceae bacterium]|nr:aminoacyl-tRNA hydrolase [Intrasporangiaceae bacterium]
MRETERVAENLVVSRRWVVPGGELQERFSRSSGPGGQGVNTADSRVELRYDVAASASIPPELRSRILRRLSSRLTDGVIKVVASEHRTQLANRRAARARMAVLLRDAGAPPPRPRRATTPTAASRRRRFVAKRQRSELKRGRGSRAGSIHD